MIILKTIGNYLTATHDDGTTQELPTKDIRYRDDGGVNISLISVENNNQTLQAAWTEFRDKDGNPFASFDVLIDFLRRNTGGYAEQGQTVMDVFVQDQNTPAVIAKLSTVEHETSMTIAGAVEDMAIEVADATGVSAGDYVTIFSVTANRFYIGYVTGVASTTINLDSPLDFAFPLGSAVTFGQTDMAVDGSTTPVIYGLRNTDAAIDTDVDITRILITCLTTNAPAYDEFGDIAGGLVNGLVLRTKDGEFKNIFNVKTNGEMAGISYDLSAADAVNPNQGQNGWISRLTFAGQSKMGVVVRIESGEDLQAIVQDDLSSLDKFEIVVEGHIVES